MCNFFYLPIRTTVWLEFVKIDEAVKHKQRELIANVMLIWISFVKTTIYDNDLSQGLPSLIIVLVYPEICCVLCEWVKNGEKSYRSFMPQKYKIVLLSHDCSKQIYIITDSLANVLTFIGHFHSFNNKHWCILSERPMSCKIVKCKLRVCFARHIWKQKRLLRPNPCAPLVQLSIFRSS